MCPERSVTYVSNQSIPVSECWLGFLLCDGFVTGGWFESIEVLCGNL